MLGLVFETGRGLDCHNLRTERGIYPAKHESELPSGDGARRQEFDPGADVEFEGLSGVYAERRHLRDRNWWEAISGERDVSVVDVEQVGEELACRECADRVLELRHRILQVAERAILLDLGGLGGHG